MFCNVKALLQLEIQIKVKTLLWVDRVCLVELKDYVSKREELGRLFVEHCTPDRKIRGANSSV